MWSTSVVSWPDTGVTFGLDPLSSNINFCVKVDYELWSWISITAGGLVGNMFVWHTINPGSIFLSVGYIVTQMITIMSVLCHWIPSVITRFLWTAMYRPPCIINNGLRAYGL